MRYNFILIFRFESVTKIAKECEEIERDRKRYSIKLQIKLLVRVCVRTLTLLLFLSAAQGDCFCPLAAASLGKPLTARGERIRLSQFL